MHITEPVTMLTDYAMGAASLLFGLTLRKHISSNNRTTIRLWTMCFIAVCIAALVGGTYHGFASYFSDSSLRGLWNVTMYSSGFAGGAIVSAAIASDVGGNKLGRKWLAAGTLITLGGIAVQQTGFRHGRDVNHNDIYHLIQIAGLYYFFRCACVVGDRRPS